ncbi:ycf32-related poly protein of photosystem II [Scenedesmus sp. NREL 46B-D3]|nr:ycf32-related poly protein of photosystem II [Scenedesmus sp. NREL 46B-D3]
MGGFNMLQPATNQLNRMNEIREATAGASTGRKKRGVAGAVGLGAALSLFAAQNADAATELSQLAASDNRLSTISLLFLPALAWVGFNMLQPATNQLNRMNEIREATAGASTGRKKRGVAGAVGLGAALLGTISLLFLPALAWVGFNMLQPATNQLNRMNEIREATAGASTGRKKRGVAGAVGLGAALSLFAAQNAEAATELSQLAASDNRFGTIALLFLPVIGWVGFNILQPAFNQLNRQNEIREDAAPTTGKVAGGKRSGNKRRGVAGAVGLGAAMSLFAAQNADAATELSQLAASDNRFGTIALLFLPVVGWVGFNILQPAFNQLNRQNEIREDAAGSVKAAKPAKGSKPSNASKPTNKKRR